MTNVQYFTNDKYKVLSCLYDSRGNDGISRMTQQEVADTLGLSRVTINVLFKQLKEDGYLVKDMNRASKHMLTEKAITTIEMFRKSDE